MIFFSSNIQPAHNIIYRKFSFRYPQGAICVDKNKTFALVPTLLNPAVSLSRMSIVCATFMYSGEGEGGEKIAPLIPEK